MIGDDTNEVDLHFINKVNSRVNVSWVQKGGSDHGKHILMGEMNGVGDKVNLNSFHGDEFVLKMEAKMDMADCCIKLQWTMIKVVGILQNNRHE